MSPRFRKTSLLYAFKCQHWRFEIPVRDPELLKLTYQFIGDSHGMEISSAGVITWIPTELNKTYQFTINATDPCGASSHYSFNVETKNCKCNGTNQICVLNSTALNESITCQCPHGCTGPQ